MSRSRSILAIAFLGSLLLPLSAARAQFDDVVLFSSYVPPNVMILLDNHVSMNIHLEDDDYDASVVYPSFCDWGEAPTVPCRDLTGGAAPTLCPDTNYAVGDDPNDPNPTAPHQLTGSAVQTVTACGVTRTLYHNKNTVSKTRYSLNYLNWLFGVATAEELLDEPTITRLQGAQDMLTTVINEINFPDPNTGEPVERLRMGLAVYTRAGSGEGAQFKSGISNSASTNSVISAIGGVTANAEWAPISEALLDIGRYYAGKDFQLGTLPVGSQTSPIDVSCRKNFVILISSGAPWEDLHDQWPIAFLETIGNADGDGNECSIPNDTCTDAPSTGRDDQLTYLHNGSDWLDDVALYLYNTDLSALDGDQNLVTYTIGFQVDHPLLEETAQNGDGKYYTTAGGNSTLLLDHLRAAMIDIIERATAFSAASVPASRTSFGDGFYTAYFVPRGTHFFWEGHLEAYRLDETGAIRDIDGNLVIDPLSKTFREPRRPFWDAANVLRTMGSRNLLTTKYGTYRDEFSTVTIDEYDLNLSSSELGLYPNDPTVPFATTGDLADALVNYIHGQDAFDEDRDGDSSELRDHILGDLYHADPVVVGPPPRARMVEEGFEVAATGTPFAELYQQRDRVLYIGGNDGMLHAFDAGEYMSGDNPLTSNIVENGYYTPGYGTELFGWVPGLLLDELKHIPRNLPRTHYYVDGDGTAADAWLPDPYDPNDVSKEPSEWTTVFVTGFRQGGPGYLALDITNPDAVSASDPHGPYPKLLWEFNHANLGESWSQPVVTRVKVRGSSGLGDHCGHDDGDGDCRERWVAIFGGGYRPDADPNLATYVSDPSAPGWSNASKAIFMVALDTGQVLASIEFDATGSNGPAAMRFALPGSPAVLDVDFDGFADVVYLGDLGGQLWKWDISGVGEDLNNDTTVDTWPYGVFFHADPEPMQGGGTHYRSFFFPPSAAFSGGKLHLAFGSAERSDMHYRGSSNDDDENRFYVVRDDQPTGSGAFPGPLGESDLTFLDNADYDTDPTDAGFFIKGRENEKFATSHAIFAGYVLTTSYLPDFVSPDVCDRRGESFLYTFKLATGAGYFADASTAGDAARRISIGLGAPNEPRITISHSGDQLYIQTSAGQLVQMPPPPRPGKPLELIFWRQNF